MITYDVTIKDLKNTEKPFIYRDITKIEEPCESRGRLLFPSMPSIPMSTAASLQIMILYDVNGNRTVIPLTPGFIYEINKIEDFTGLSKEDLLGKMFVPKSSYRYLPDVPEYNIRIVVDVGDDIVRHINKSMFDGLDKQYDPYIETNIHEFQQEYIEISDDKIISHKE